MDAPQNFPGMTAEQIAELPDAMLALKRVRPFLNAPEVYTKAERDDLNAEVSRLLKILAPETEV